MVTHGLPVGPYGGGADGRGEQPALDRRDGAPQPSPARGGSATIDRSTASSNAMDGRAADAGAPYATAGRSSTSTVSGAVGAAARCWSDAEAAALPNAEFVRSGSTDLLEGAKPPANRPDLPSKSAGYDSAALINRTTPAARHSACDLHAGDRIVAPPAYRLAAWNRHPLTSTRARGRAMPRALSAAPRDRTDAFRLLRTW